MSKRHSAYLITVPAAIIIGFPMWLVWKYIPDLFPFLVCWLVCHPVYKIWKEMGSL